MDTRPVWGGVDWFGCEDDLLWESLDTPEPLARPVRPRAATRTSRAPRTAPRGPLRRVLILDVENVCPSSRRPQRAMTRLRAVLEAAGPVDEIIAASAASQHDRLDDVLRRAGIQTHLRCGNRPNAADRALIDAARRFASRGDCEVIVASNDHGFRAIASLPGVRRLVLITQPQLATARSLLKVANELRVA